MSMDEMDAELVLNVVAYQDFADFLGMSEKKRWLRFVGRKLIVSKAVLSKGK